MVSIFLNVFRSRYKPASWVYSLGISVIELISRILGRKVQVDFQRFKSSQWLPSGASKSAPLVFEESKYEIDLVIVVTKKDFSVLEFSLPRAIAAIAPENRGQIRLIVPPQDINECNALFANFETKILVSNEETLISESERNKLKIKFEDRYTWVLQQILKIAAVLDSNSKATLIVDADTVLLREREWFTKSGQQILMPSEELNPDYYEFLFRYGLCKNPPDFSFVSHHMLFQKRFMLEALLEIGVTSIHELVDSLVRNVEIKSQSPVCVDYELYAQFMYTYFPEKIMLQKWSNIGISSLHLAKTCNSWVTMRVLKFFYNSVSFHSWS